MLFDTQQVYYILDPWLAKRALLHFKEWLHEFDGLKSGLYYQSWAISPYDWIRFNNCGKFATLKVKLREVNAEDGDANPYSTFEEIEAEVNPYFTHEIPNSPDR